MGAAFLGTPTVTLPRVTVSVMSPVMDLVTAVRTSKLLVALRQVRVYMHKLHLEHYVYAKTILTKGNVQSAYNDFDSLPHRYHRGNTTLSNHPDHHRQ